MKKNVFLLAALAASFALPALAADLPTKAPALPYQYPVAKCGLYYGLDGGGSTGAIANSVAGTQMTQGYVGLTVGYSCPAGTVGFWYADADFDFHNINGGNTQGLSAFSGPALFKQRFGFGMPFDKLISAIPGISQLQSQLPSIANLLPAGQNVVSSNASIYLSPTWDDVGAKFGLQNFQTFEFGLDVGVSMKTLVSNGMVLEPYVQMLIPSTAQCIGRSIVGGCIRETNRTMAGVKWLF